MVSERKCTKLQVNISSRNGEDDDQRLLSDHYFFTFPSVNVKLLTFRKFVIVLKVHFLWWKFISCWLVDAATVHWLHTCGCGLLMWLWLAACCLNMAAKVQTWNFTFFKVNKTVLALSCCYQRPLSCLLRYLESIFWYPTNTLQMI